MFQHGNMACKLVIYRARTHMCTVYRQVCMGVSKQLLLLATNALKVVPLNTIQRVADCGSLYVIKDGEQQRVGWLLAGWLAARVTRRRNAIRQLGKAVNATDCCLLPAICAPNTHSQYRYIARQQVFECVDISVCTCISQGGIAQKLSLSLLLLAVVFGLFLRITLKAFTTCHLLFSFTLCLLLPTYEYVVLLQPTWHQHGSQFVCLLEASLRRLLCLFNSYVTLALFATFAPVL